MQKTIYVAITLLIANLNAIIDQFLHPEIPYFDDEHLIVGGITSLVLIILFVIVVINENKLIKSEESQRTVLKTAMDGFLLADKEGRLLEVNDAYCRMSGYSKPELLAMHIPDLMASETTNETAAHIQKIIAQGEDRFQTRHRRKDGSFFEAEVSTQFRPDDGGQFVAFVQNVTKRKQAEENIQASLREKDLLLNEIHHRVKNNLQVISGLLKLQAKSNKNAELIESFQKSEDRIQAMAMVHEKLYQSGDLSKIDLVGYCGSLSEQLLLSYNINPRKIDLTIQADGEVYVNISKAIPCGLIMNELISNALKHAFPGDGPGELKIIIGETKKAEIEVVIRDNGLGLPDNIDIHQPRSVGLHVVNGLAKHQLDGQVEVRRDKGTEFRITFPV